MMMLDIDDNRLSAFNNFTCIMNDPLLAFYLIDWVKDDLIIRDNFFICCLW